MTKIETLKQTHYEFNLKVFPLSLLLLLSQDQYLSIQGSYQFFIEPSLLRKSNYGNSPEMKRRPKKYTNNFLSRYEMDLSSSPVSVSR